MPTPVRIVITGGLPVIDTDGTPGATPMTPVDSPLQGIPVVVVEHNGIPVTFVNADYSDYADATVADQTINFGALTLASAGGAKAVDSNGDLVDFVSVDSVVSGTGTGWTVVDDCLVRTTGTPAASDGAVLECTTTLGTINVTLATEANAMDIRDEAQLLAATDDLDGTSTASTIYVRQDAELTTWDDDWFDGRTNTAIITVEGRSSTQSKWASITTSSPSVLAPRMSNPGYFTYKYIHFHAIFDRTQHSGNSRGILFLGTARGPVKFSFCEFSGTSWDTIGPGPHHRGLIGGSLTTAYDFEISDSVIHDSRRGYSIGITAGSAGDLILERNLTYDISVDFWTVAEAAASTTMTDLDMHSPRVDNYRIFFKSSPNTYLTRSGSLTGAADGKQLLFRAQIEFDDAISAEQIIFETGGFTVRRLATGEIRAIANDTGASPAVTMTTTGTAGSYRRVHILVSINTDGTSYLSVGTEGYLGAFTWEDVSTTAAGETLDLTGTTTISGAGTSETYFSEVNYWQGVSPDVSDTTVRAVFAETGGMAASRSTLLSTYPSPLVDFYGLITVWSTGANLGSGGTFTLTGGLDTDHVDLIQFIPKKIIRNISLDNIVMYAGRFDALRGSERYDDHGGQGVFGEDTERSTATMTIASPGVVSDVGHGLSENDPVSFTTTGALPTGVTASQIYYVISTGLTADAFQFSETVGGSAVNTSGSQSGVHSRISHYVDCEMTNILYAGTSSFGARFSNGVRCKIHSCTAVLDPTWTTDYNSDAPLVGVYEHNNGGGTSNEIYDNMARGIVSDGTGNTTENNIEARADDASANAWSNLFVGDGSGGYAVTSFDEFKSVFAAKTSGPLDADPPIGALDDAGEFTTPRDIVSASPTLVNTSTEDDITTGTSTQTVNLPASMQEDDLVIVYIVSDSDLSVDGNGGLQSAQGYTDIARPAGGVPGVHIAYKFMGSTPDTTVTVEQNSVRGQAVAIQAWRGVDTTTPIDATVTTASGASGLPNPPSFTTVTNNAVRVIVGCVDDDNVSDAVAPSGFSDLLSEAYTSSNSSTVMVASSVASTAGALDPDAFTGTGDDQWHAYHFALRPE